MGKESFDEVVEVQLPSKTRHLNAVRILTHTLAESMGFGPKESDKAALAVEEALTNVMEHAYRGEPDHPIRVIYEMEGNKLTVRILHYGDQIDSTLCMVPDDFTHYHKQKKKGGLGILIMRRYMDEITYRTGPDENECCMIKYLKK